VFVEFDYGLLKLLLSLEEKEAVIYVERGVEGKRSSFGSGVLAE